MGSAKVTKHSRKDSDPTTKGIRKSSVSSMNRGKPGGMVPHRHRNQPRRSAFTTTVHRMSRKNNGPSEGK